MNVTSKQYRFLKEILKSWTQRQLLDEDQRQTLQNSLQVNTFQWKALATYSLWGALLSALLSLMAIAMDEALVEWFKRVFYASDITKSLSLAGVACSIFMAGLVFQRRVPARIFSHEMLYFAGGIVVAGAIYFLGEALDSDSGHYSLLLLLAACVYGILGLGLQSFIIWLAALGVSVVWLYAEIEFQSDGVDRYQGMSLPLWFVVYGAVLYLLSYGLLVIQSFRSFFQITQFSGLLLTFSGLWVLTMIGNYEHTKGVYELSSIETWSWVGGLLLMSLLATGAGLKRNDSMLTKLGISFVFINIYTCFFQYSWDAMHKSVFFALLGMSFWLIGRYFETLWLGVNKRKIQRK